mmetsp:Transcript_40878/g.102283  ORF Transcript_40878/g.102283 Transcript_40878/m.102283 type:complete len:457 (+) Transcript_40878:107-1477(+)|eukprot:CAMPEP_0173436084 /NCGR_PEP_ID=MMETSP1357-20121228/15750_1 /TAXON_ID=77926 /ORGANISM="Hemiselmis rufescens, Strain PCC563" /LENGTH=456 /DNA_ID=CAMNT_0014401137 /DNA_START=79 /DNA_END=1449 /DNA_ORIENTATION=-
MIVTVSGSAAWDATGKTLKKGEETHGEMLGAPTVLAPDQGLKFSSVFSGSGACHTICVTEEGKAYSFGRNDKGQLGQGDLMTRGVPTIIKPLESVRVVKASCGKNHTLILTSGGEVWSCGGNQFGQLGIGKTSEHVEKVTLLPSLGSKVVDIAAGQEFSMLLTEDSKVFSCGHPEYGVLGHGTDGKYIISTGREGFRELSSPTQIVQWHLSDAKGKDSLGATVPSPTIKRIYCGQKHTLAVDSEGCLWAWGYNGYGRLGLNDPHDRKRPCKVDFFTGPNAIKDFDLVAAGGSTSGAVTSLGQLYTWGQIKKVSESQIKPFPCQDLSGWRIRSMSFGHESFVIAADSNKEPRRPWIPGCEEVPQVITWGAAKYGELGYGGSKKSSANPDLVPSLTGKKVKSVAAGQGHSVFLLETEDDAADLPTYTPPADVAPAAAAKAGGKRPAGGAKGGAPKKKR